MAFSCLPGKQVAFSSLYSSYCGHICRLDMTFQSALPQKATVVSAAPKDFPSIIRHLSSCLYKPHHAGSRLLVVLYVP